MLKHNHSCRSVMEQAFIAYKSKKGLSDKGFMEDDAHTWAEIQAALQKSSKMGKISRAVSKIADIKISDQVGSIIGSSTHVVIAYNCVRMALVVAMVSSTPYCNRFRR